MRYYTYILGLREADFSTFSNAALFCTANNVLAYLGEDPLLVPIAREYTLNIITGLLPSATTRAARELAQEYEDEEDYEDEDYYEDEDEDEDEDYRPDGDAWATLSGPDRPDAHDDYEEYLK